MKPFTREEIERAIKLRATRLKWVEIATRLDRDQSSLEVTVSKFKAGRWGKTYQKRRVVLLEIERLVVVEGVTSGKEIARRLGLNHDNTNLRLRKLGLDLEMRREIANDLALERQAA